jgi:hypothetical protein
MRTIWYLPLVVRAVLVVSFVINLPGTDQVPRSCFSFIFTVFFTFMLSLHLEGVLRNCLALYSLFRIRSHTGSVGSLPVFGPPGSGPRSFHQQARIKKNLYFNCFCDFSMIFYNWRVNVLTVRNKQKKT